MEKEDPELLIPTHISRRAFVSIQCFILVSILAYKLEYYYVSIHLFFLYIVSHLHWNYVKRSSLIKTIDTTAAVSFIVSFTLLDSARFYEYRPVWYLTALLTTVMFCVNEILLYYQVLYPRTMPEMIMYHDRRLQWIMNYFTFTYTKPNTAAREWAYCRSVYTHMMFVHFIPNIIASFCGIITFKYRYYDNPNICI